MTGVLADVMQACPPCVDAGLSVAFLSEVFETHQSERVLVVRDGLLQGAICESELARHVCHCSDVTAGDLAGRHVLTATEKTPIEKAFRAFSEGIDRVIVILRDGRPVGCVRQPDLFGWAKDSATGNPMSRPHLLHRGNQDPHSVARPAG